MVASGSGVAALLVIFLLSLGGSAWASNEHPVNHIVSISESFAGLSASVPQTVISVHHVVNVPDSFPVSDSVSAKLGQGYSALAEAHGGC